ncbi:MAG: phosphoribosyl-AMP cyclohydrolase [Rhizobiaceae bacterium]|nr:phosphoribosyl-AMP cyclohydrolase [Rhizobiaceae bacterium]
MTDPLFPPPSDKKELESSTAFTPRFDKDGLITAIVTDYDSGELLMVAHMNDEALAKTIATGSSYFWSRSRQELWHKGATSGTRQNVHEIRTDCDQDAIWLKVTVAGAGATCHTGMKACFYRTVELKDGKTRLVRDRIDPLFDSSDIYGNKT